MSRTVYVNGAFVAEEDAKVSIFDRGFVFADSVYEVTAVLDGKLIDFDGHCSRLERSLKELQMEMPVSPDALLELHRQLISKNEIINGLVYLQISRGAADRDFAFPPAGTPQTLVMFTQQKDIVNAPVIDKGLKVISMEDIRWGRRDIKTVQLLAPCLAKMEAKAQGKDDAWLLDGDGLVNEATSSNAYIITKEGAIVTRHLSNSILSGITRTAMLKVAAETGMTIEERPFTIAEAQQASEAFITSATTFLCPVVEIDGTEISGGKLGTVSKRLRELYIEEGRKVAI